MVAVIPEALRALIKKSGLSQKGVSRAAGLNDTAVRDILTGRSKNPSYTTVTGIAQVLGVSPDKFIGPASRIAPPLEGRTDIEGPRDLPVYGAVKAGVEFEEVDYENPIDWIERPPPLVGVHDAYALYVINDSMEPRYFEGETVACRGRRLRRRNLR